MRPILAFLIVIWALSAFAQSIGSRCSGNECDRSRQSETIQRLEGEGWVIDHPPVVYGLPVKMRRGEFVYALPNGGLSRPVPITASP